MILYLTLNKEKLDYMNFEKFKGSLLGLKEVMNETENAEDECELKIWKLKKNRKKKIKRIWNKKRRRVKMGIIKSNEFFKT